MEKQQSVQPIMKLGRFRLSMLLLKETFKVFRSEPMLVRYVVTSSFFCFLVFVFFAIISLLTKTILFASPNDYTSSNSHLSLFSYIGIFVYYLITFYVINFYGAGLAANVLDLCSGKKLSYSDYMKKARSKSINIFVYSLIEATVGILLRLIADKSSFTSKLLTQLLGGVWSIATLFTIPIMISTERGPIDSVKDSAKLMIHTWGENLIARGSLSLAITFLFVLPVTFLFIGIAVLLAILFHWTGLFIGVFLLITVLFICALLTNTAKSILNTVMYFYASNNKIPLGFDEIALKNMFTTKK